MKHVTLYTDGACSGNPGPGGWGAILQHGQSMRELSGYDAATTNNRMEMLAVIMGLRALNEPCAVRIVTDSKYVLQGATEWIKGWQRNGWRTADKKPVKNADLWQDLLAASAPHTLQWEWVRGHTGHIENERCDELARAAIAAHNQ